MPTTSRDATPNTRSDNVAERSVPELRVLLEQAVGSPFTDGNSIRILQNGDEIFPAMLAAIDGAERRVDLATFVYWTGDIAQKIASALAARARAGLRVRVLLDAFGASKMDADLVHRMTDAGAEVRWFRPLATWRLWRSDKRTHRKLLICDDVVGFTGGVGIAEEWEGDARNPDEWRDTHVALRGPALNALRAAFMDNWNEAGGWELEEEIARPVAQAEDVPVQVVRASSTVGWTDMATLLRALIALSRERLRIVTAYFNPDDTLVDLLVAARKRGVDVQLLVPGPYCDSRLSQLAGHPLLQTLLEADVRVWRYLRTMLHAKLVTVDSTIACVGSANLNHRSMAKDEECCIVALSSDAAKQLDRRFDDDCESAELYDARAWAERGTWLRIQERLARLIVEQL